MVSELSSSSNKDLHLEHHRLVRPTVRLRTSAGIAHLINKLDILSAIAIRPDPNLRRIRRERQLQLALVKISRASTSSTPMLLEPGGSLVELFVVPGKVLVEVVALHVDAPAFAADTLVGRGAAHAGVEHAASTAVGVGVSGHDFGKGVGVEVDFWVVRAAGVEAVVGVVAGDELVGADWICFGESSQSRRHREGDSRDGDHVCCACVGCDRIC